MSRGLSSHVCGRLLAVVVASAASRDQSVPGPRDRLRSQSLVSTQQAQLAYVTCFVIVCECNICPISSTIFLRVQADKNNAVIVGACKLVCRMYVGVIHTVPPKSSRPTPSSIDNFVDSQRIFKKSFYWQMWKIWDKTIVKDSTTLKNAS